MSCTPSEVKNSRRYVVFREALRKWSDIYDHRCIPVKTPDKDDWEKLRRCFSYLQGTKYMKLTLEASNLRVIEWWVDASYTTHSDYKGHSGGMMSLEKGATTSSCNKQKQNVKSSTDGKIVGGHSFLGKITWSKRHKDIRLIIILCTRTTSPRFD